MPHLLPRRLQSKVWLRSIKLIFCWLIICAPLSAHAGMELSNVVFHFEPDESSRQDIEVFNTGEHPLYVEVTASAVIAPGQENEDRVPISDPREAGLLVTPNKLIVPPGGTKVVRLVKMGRNPKERIYRIAMKPVVKGVEAKQSGLKIMIGYEVLAIVYANNPRPDLQVTRTGKMLRVHNAGNVNVLLREGYQCESPDLTNDQCTVLPGRRMYPGNTWETELPHDLPVTFYQSTGMRNFVETYP